MRAFVPLKRRAVVEYGLGQPPPLSDEGIPIIRATNIFRGRIVSKDMIRARIEDLPLDRAPLLKAGEVLVVRSGAYTGDSALVTPEWVGSAPGYDLRITPGPGLEPRFVAYTMLGRRVADQIELAKSRAAQPHLNAEDLGEVDVLDAPVKTQRAVADYLDRETARIDALIAAKRRMGALLTARRSLVIDAALGDGYAQRGKTSSCWTVQRLKTVLAAPPCYGVLKPEHYEGHDGVPLLRIKNMVSGSIDCDTLMTISPAQADEYRRTRLRLGDVVLSVVGTIGKAATVQAPLQGANISRAIARLQPTKGISSRYIELWCSTSAFRRRCDEVCNITAQPVLNMGDLREFPIALPRAGTTASVVAELEKILAPLDAMTGIVQRQQVLLRERRQALITAAVTGQLDLQEAA